MLIYHVCFDTTFFLKDISSIKVVLKDLNSLFGFSGLRSNFIKWQEWRNSRNKRPEKS